MFSLPGELEFTLEVCRTVPYGLGPKLKQFYYISKLNRGGQAYIAVIVATI